jgi:hypothetical protein
LVKDRARPTDVVILPTIGDELHLRGVAQRVLRAVPTGASLLVAVAEPARVRPDDAPAAVPADEPHEPSPNP